MLTYSLVRLTILFASLSIMFLNGFTWSRKQALRFMLKAEPPVVQDPYNTTLGYSFRVENATLLNKKESNTQPLPLLKTNIVS